jgi:hypothetical protein
LSSFANAADGRIVFERAGFLGQYALGGSYEITPEHAVDLMVGVYHVSSNDYYQTSLIYRYSRWNTTFYGNNWRPLQFGIFATYSLDQDRYFMKSPGKYPDPNYYDETALRYGAEISSTFTFMPIGIGIGYHLRIFDSGIIAMFNNSNRDVQYYISSGISLQYLF